MDTQVAQRVSDKLSSILAEPHRFLSRLKNSDYYKLRIGSWHALILVDDSDKTIFVTRVLHRSKAYDLF